MNRFTDIPTGTQLLIDHTAAALLLAVGVLVVIHAYKKRRR